MNPKRYAAYRYTAVVATIAVILADLEDHTWIAVVLWLAVLARVVRDALQDRRERLGR